MAKEDIEIIKQKLDIVADLSIENLKSAVKLFNTSRNCIENYRKRPEIREKLNEYAKNKMREMRARRKANKENEEKTQEEILNI